MRAVYAGEIVKCLSCGSYHIRRWTHRRKNFTQVEFYCLICNAVFAPIIPPRTEFFKRLTAQFIFDVETRLLPLWVFSESQIHKRIRKKLILQKAKNITPELLQKHPHMRVLRTFEGYRDQFSHARSSQNPLYEINPDAPPLITPSPFHKDFIITAQLTNTIIGKIAEINSHTVKINQKDERIFTMTKKKIKTPFKDLTPDIPTLTQAERKLLSTLDQPRTLQELSQLLNLSPQTITPTLRSLAKKTTIVRFKIKSTTYYAHEPAFSEFIQQFKHSLPPWYEPWMDYY